MPPTREPPTWRKIESALIELLREEGLAIEQERGETYTAAIAADGSVAEINIGDFAQHLADRLA